MAAVLENVPRRARGIVGGFTQQGFAAGYLLASGFHLAMCENYYTSPYRPRTQLICSSTVPMAGFVLARSGSDRPRLRPLSFHDLLLKHSCVSGRGG